MAFSASVIKHEIREIGPKGSSQGGVWDRLWLQLGAKPAQGERERIERKAEALLAKEKRAAETAAQRAARVYAQGWTELASAARAAVKSERETRKAQQARESATWDRFRNAPAYRDAFTPKGRIRDGWALVNGVPCYLPAALAALANSRGVAAAGE